MTRPALPGLLAQVRRRSTPARITGATIVGTAVLVAAVALTVRADTATTTATAAQGQAATAEQQKAQTVLVAAPLASQVLAACAAGGPTAQQLVEIGACNQAAQVANSPAVTSAPPIADASQVDQAVAQYLLAHPPPAGRPPSIDEITAAVGDYLTAHPPAPGRPPTSDEITAAVSAYLATHPPAPGKDGQPGANATDAQVAAAVAAYMAAHPAPAGPAGAQGQQGAQGATGPAGPPGPVCGSGTHSAPYTYPDGTAGTRCVNDTQPTTAASPTPAAG